MDTAGELGSLLGLLNSLPDNPEPGQAPPEAQSTSAPAGDGGLLSVVQAGLSAFGKGEKDDRAQLLEALIPFISPERGKRVATAIRIMRVADTLSCAVYGERKP